jgi:cyanophycin synthetase
MKNKGKKLNMTKNTIGLEQDWTVLNGMAYGITQPTLYGVITTNIECSTSFELLDRIIKEWLNIDISPSIESQKSDHLFITKVLTWQSRLQQQHQVPTFEKYTINQIEPIHQNEQRYLVALPYYKAEVTRELLNWFVFVINYILENTEDLSHCSEKELKVYFAEADKYLQSLRSKLNGCQLKGMNTYLFFRAADKLSIPISHVALNVFRFGTGKYNQLLDSSFTEKTSVIGSKISKSKSSTTLLLRSAGMPAPIHFRVSNEEQVLYYCDKIGFPVVIKPDNLDQGQGVFAHLSNKKQTLKAYRAASKLSKNILIEQHVNGNDYRITVLNNKVIKVVKRTAAGVVGNGKLNINQLVNKEQKSKFLQETLRKTGVMKLSLDEEALDLLIDQNLSKHTVPEKGQYVALRRQSNMSTGGSVSLINESEVHPDNLSLAIRASQAANLDLAGVDLLIPDISKSWLKSHAIICEINAQPQIGNSVTAHIYEEVLNTLMDNKKGIPLHLVIISRSNDVIAPTEVDNIMKKYQCNALAIQSGLWVNNVRVTKPFINSFVAVTTLIQNKEATSGLCVMNQQDVENIGLPIARFTSIDVYNSEPLNSQRMIGFLDKIKGHTDTLNQYDSKVLNEL